MGLTAIEWIATVVAVISIIKIIVIVVNKQKWLGVTKAVYGSKAWATVFLVLAAIVFWNIIQVFSIVQIFAVLGFVVLLIGFGFMSYSKEMLSMIEKVYKKKINGWMRVYMIVWLVLCLWVLKEVFL